MELRATINANDSIERLQDQLRVYSSPTDNITGFYQAVLSCPGTDNVVLWTLVQVLYPGWIAKRNCSDSGTL